MSMYIRHIYMSMHIHHSFFLCPIAFLFSLEIHPFQLDSHPPLHVYVYPPSTDCCGVGTVVGWGLLWGGGCCGVGLLWGGDCCGKRDEELYATDTVRDFCRGRERGRGRGRGRVGGRGRGRGRGRVGGGGSLASPEPDVLGWDLLRGGNSFHHLSWRKCCGVRPVVGWDPAQHSTR